MRHLDQPTLTHAVDALASTEKGFRFVRGGVEDAVEYAELRDRVQSLARRFLGAGLAPGDRVLLVLVDGRGFAETFLAAMRACLVPVPVFPPYLPGHLEAYPETLRRLVKAAGARAAVVSPALHEHLVEGLGDVEVTLSPEDLEAAPLAASLPEATPEQPAFLQFTSGSTGHPKGVVVTHRNLLANAAGIGRDVLGADSSDRGVSWLPLYHDMGLIGFVVMPLLAELSTWLLPPLEFARDPLSWPELLHRVGGTASFAPNFAYGLLARRTPPERVASWRLDRWRVAGCGAEPIRPQVLRAFADRYAPSGFSADALTPCYGMAEATLAVAAHPATQAPRFRTVSRSALAVDGVAGPAAEQDDELELVSCGPAIPGHELRIVDEAGAPVGPGRQGEIWFHGGSVAAGYWQDATATRAAFAQGWLRTGDLGFLDEDDYLYVTGRIKDLVIVNGRNYHPQDIEWRAAEVAGVRKGRAVSFADQSRGDERLVIVLEPDRDADVGGLPGRVRTQVRDAVGITPSDVVVVARDSLPMTTSGKLRRSEARNRYARGLFSPVGEDA